MWNKQLLFETKTKFLRNVNFLKHKVEPILGRLEGLEYSGNKLKNASSRIVVPLPFKGFIDLIEKSTGRKFPTNLQFTKDEVIEADKEILASFSTPNFNFRRLNLEVLLLAAFYASEDCGFYSRDFDKMSPEQSCDEFPSQSSSGFPIYRPKKEPEPRADALRWTHKYTSSPTISEILRQPTTVFHRFQYKVSSTGNEIGKKIRPVWGLSFRVSCLEGVYFRDLVNGCSEFQNQLTTPLVAQGLTNPQLSDRIIKYFRKNCDTIFSLDVRQFDSNVPSFAWPLFFAFLPKLVSSDLTDDKILSNLMSFYCYTPYCYRDTILQFQRRGVPSGSLITSLFDSWFSRLVANYAFLEHCEVRASNYCCVLGDDNLICGDYFDLDYITDVYSRFGMTVSKEKSGVFKYNTEISFLGRIWDLKNRPTEPENWYISHLALPSRFYTNLPFPVSVMQTYRGISLCMSLYKGLENFERLVGYGDFVWIDLKRRYRLENENPVIRIVSEDQSTFLLGVPLSRILAADWRLF